MEAAVDIMVVAGRAAVADGPAVAVAGRAVAAVFRAEEAQAEVGKFT